MQHGHVPAVSVARIASLGEDVAKPAARLVAPAIFLEQGAGCECVPAAVAAHAAGQVGALAGAAAVGQVGREAGRVQPGTGGHGQRAAQGIEAVGRVGTGYQRHARQRGFRDHVPTDHVAEGLVDADAVQVDRQALRHARNGRGTEAAVGDVGLERAALDVVDVDAGQVAGQILGQVAGARPVQVIAAHGLHGVGHQVAVHADARQRRGGHHQDFRQHGAVLVWDRGVLLRNSGPLGHQGDRHGNRGGGAAAGPAAASHGVARRLPWRCGAGVGWHVPSPPDKRRDTCIG